MTRRRTTTTIEASPRHAEYDVLFLPEKIKVPITGHVTAIGKFWLCLPEQPLSGPLARNREELGTDATVLPGSAIVWNRLFDVLFALFHDRGIASTYPIIGRIASAPGFL
jgi:hypothetical protein